MLMPARKTWTQKFRLARPFQGAGTRISSKTPPLTPAVLEAGTISLISCRATRELLLSAYWYLVHDRRTASLRITSNTSTMPTMLGLFDSASLQELL